MFPRLLLIALGALVLWAGAVRSSEGARRERMYVVKPADTLWAIATAHHGGDPREGVWKLQERNGLKGSLIRPGQRLVLP